MSRFYANENFPRAAVERLRELGHDVLTVYEAGNGNRAIPDDEVLKFARANDRILVTLNRLDFMKLHSASQEHGGIVVCTEDRDYSGLAARIDVAVRSTTVVVGQLLRVYRPNAVAAPHAARR